MQQPWSSLVKPMVRVLTIQILFMACIAAITNAATGTVNIQSTPSDLKLILYQDGKVIREARTPYYAQDVPTGKYSVCVELPRGLIAMQDISVSTAGSAWATLSEKSSLAAVCCQSKSKQDQPKVSELPRPSVAVNGKCKYVDASHFEKDTIPCFVSMGALLDFRLMANMPQRMKDLEELARSNASRAYAQGNVSQARKSFESAETVAAMASENLDWAGYGASKVTKAEQVIFVMNYSTIVPVEYVDDGYKQVSVGNYGKSFVVRVMLPDLRTCWIEDTYIRNAQ